MTVSPQVAHAACTGTPSPARTSCRVPASEWDITGSETQIQAFATQISVNAGTQVQFKIDTTATAYSIKIYRLGYYQGNGARLIDAIPLSGLPQQPACATDAATEIYDCGTWAVSASWTVPASRVGGLHRPTHPL